MYGDKLVDLARVAASRVVLIAPFMKLRAVSRVLEHVRPAVPVLCVTRWRLDEIASGVSDPQVWPHIRARGGQMLLRSDLHAKAYFFDDRCLVGSANLTETALGWREPRNLELMLEVPSTSGAAAELLASVREESVEVEDTLFNATVAAADMLGPRGAFHQYGDDGNYATLEQWLPILRTPESLFNVYIGSTGALTLAARESATVDLSVFRLPSGLDRQHFEKAISVQLLQMPIVASVDRLLKLPRRFGEVRDYLSGRVKDTERDYDVAWQTLMRWLRHFCPDRYVLSVPNISEVMVRKDALVRGLDGKL